MSAPMFELHYHDGGHGGPYHGQEAARLAAMRILRGYARIGAWVEIRPYDGGPVERVVQSYANRIVWKVVSDA